LLGQDRLSNLNGWVTDVPDLTAELQIALDVADISFGVEDIVTSFVVYMSGCDGSDLSSKGLLDPEAANLLLLVDFHL
jgi:hypothetical protein